MLQRNGAVVFLGAWLDACALWRLWMPHVNLPGSSFFVFRQQVDFSKIAGNDICVVQRCCTKPQFEFLKVLRQLHLKVIYDLDDNMWQIPEFNPAAKILGQYREGFAACMQWTDLVTVSTKQLAQVVRKYTKGLVNPATGKAIPVVVTENRMDCRLFSAPKRIDGLIVGWAGSSSHAGDLEVMYDGLKECIAEFPEVTFQFRGMEPAKEMRQYGNVQFRLWTPVPEFCLRMPQWGWTVALAPLVDHEFNSSKSCIKMMEAAWCKVPCLASWVDPYDRFTSYDPELRWLLCAGRSNWAPKIRELINDKARRDDLGVRAYNVLRKYYSYDEPHAGWKQALDMVRAI